MSRIPSHPNPGRRHLADPRRSARATLLTKAALLLLIACASLIGCLRFRPLLGDRYRRKEPDRPAASAETPAEERSPESLDVPPAPSPPEPQTRVLTPEEECLAKARAALHGGRHGEARYWLNRAKTEDAALHAAVSVPPWDTRAETERVERIAEQHKRMDEAPESAAAHHEAGKALLELGEIDEGLAALRKGAALAPGELGYSLDAAAAYVTYGQPDAARVVLAEAHQNNPEDARIAVPLARICESLGAWSDAADWYATAARLAEFDENADPAGQSHWRRQRARCLYRVGQYEESRRLFAASLNPEDPTVSLGELAQYGDACLRTEEYAMAQRVFDQISRRSPRISRDVELLRGLCALRRGDKELASNIASTALRHWPSDPRLKQLVELSDRGHDGTPPRGQHAREPGPLGPDSEDPPRPIPLNPSDTAEAEDGVRRTTQKQVAPQPR